MPNPIEATRIFADWTRKVKNIIIHRNDQTITASGDPATSNRDRGRLISIEIFANWAKEIKNIIIHRNDQTITASVDPQTSNTERFSSRELSLTEDTDFDVDEFIPTNNFLQRLSSLESIPKEIREVPVTEREDLARFWEIITDNPVLLNQLLIPLETLRPDPNQLISQPQDIVEQIKTELGEKIPENTLKNLETTVNEIEIPIPIPSIEEVFAAIEAKDPKIEILAAIDKLSPKAWKWLGTLLVYLVQNPNAEIDLWTII
ncbi:hypothetical protein VB711_11010 [Cronbergia sp. UHCC 0137]|uniref:hypothetical protein n=1 Tax=Cronbergia sp. UHCC 0137 TaxID=3110239 RepID=UPI002B1FC913|nr:hypothetical protein [Cronbergia sp. UHCC 0137]MEA5618362.1 hypothetical protein [Cronbergia sp. UHCC 0137]